MKARILVVDDDEALAEMIGIVLRNDGFEPVFCADGGQALEIFRSSKPDLVLLDLMLPGIDGIEVCRLIRAESDVPIGMLTAKAETSDVVRGLGERLPVMRTHHGTYDAARIVASVRGLLAHGTQRKTDTAVAVFERHVDRDALLRDLDVPRRDVVTPLMFESMLLEQARADRRCIVLPEGDDERILRAADILLRRDVVDLTIIGDPDRAPLRRRRHREHGGV